MVPAHWDPVRALRRREDAFEEFLRELFARGEAHVITPSADIAESDRDVTVRLAIPGADQEQVRISLDNSVLEVHGETRDGRDEDKRHYYRQEIRYGAFRRTIPLPAEVQVEEAKASLENGILTITIPKSKAAKGHKIKIAA